jgi:hypothetical protein
VTAEGADLGLVAYEMAVVAKNVASPALAERRPPPNYVGGNGQM